MNIQLLAVLSLCSFNLLFCTDFPPKNTSPNNSEKIFESAKRKRLSKSFHREQNPKNFSEEDIAEIELFFKNSPEEAQQVVTDIEQGRDDLNNDHRFTIFFDDSESNHEKMSAIIAYKMYKQGWNCTFLSGKSLLGKNSDHTAIRLASELKTIETSKNPTILIFHDLNQLLGYNRNSYSNSDLKNDILENILDHKKNHDPELTNEVFWNFIRKQTNNKDFFLIGTMDTIENLPKATKNTIIMNIIEFPSES